MASLGWAAASVSPPPSRAGEPARWWLRADALCDPLIDRAASTAHFAFGDARLHLEAESPQLLQEIEARYGECAILVAPEAAARSLRCRVRCCDDDRLVSLRFEAADPVDAFATALALLQHPAAAPLFAEMTPAPTGWRFIARVGTATPVVAAHGAMALLDPARLPAGFLVDLLVQPVLALQRELLFVHAASLGIGAAGVLLIGPSGSGKTTTALTLASRGHGYFGDDIAAIRTASTELLTLRSTANVRPGPHASALARHVERGPWQAPHADGLPRLHLRVADVFPSAAATPVPLRRALFLRRFAPLPRLEPFAPTLHTLGSASPLALNKALWLAWGTTEQRRLLQFMLFVRMLARVRCAWLDVGDPESTADLIEATMEGSWD